MISWKLNILELLTGNESILVAIMMIHNTDFVAGKHQNSSVLIVSSDILESFVDIEERWWYFIYFLFVYI